VDFNYKLPDEDIEPEVARRLVVKAIELPSGEDFKGSIGEDELKKFDARFHPLILADSKTVHALEYLWLRVVVFNRQVRKKHAEEIRRGRSFTHWLEIVIAATVGALVSYLVGKL
jgi:hypothetical protein